MVYTFTSRQQAEDFHAFASDVFVNSQSRLTLTDNPPLVRIADAYQDEIELFVARALAFSRGYERAKQRVEHHLKTCI